MPEFKFNDSQCQSLKLCDLSDEIIHKIEQLLDLETAFIEHFRRIKFKIPKGQISKIRSHILTLRKLLSEFDVDNVYLLPEKESLMTKLKSADASLMKMQKRKRGNVQTRFHDEIDDLAPKIAQILINNAIKIDRRGQTFERVLNIVFKAIGVKRRPGTAIKNRWEPEIRLRIAYAKKGVDYDFIAEEFEECD